VALVWDRYRFGLGYTTSPSRRLRQGSTPPQQSWFAATMKASREVGHRFVDFGASALCSRNSLRPGYLQPSIEPRARFRRDTMRHDTERATRVSCLERRTSDDRRGDRQTSTVNSRCCRLPQHRSTGDNAGRLAPDAGGRSRFGICRPAVLGFAAHWRDRQFVRRLIEDEFQSADVTAIDALRFGHVAIVSDLGLAGRTLPRHESDTVRLSQIVIKARSCGPRSAKKRCVRPRVFC
jgi:hypothetical protein